ncbi:hypothetical protein ACFPM0_13820 [Pseudonocardia sulfidoxydans]|uniref:hypothetical protein n=1 Tax=Pseudonocardia sulfidoxydans TaxID=54011 RepID=UPI00360F644C
MLRTTFAEVALRVTRSFRTEGHPTLREWITKHRHPCKTDRRRGTGTWSIEITGRSRR